MKNTFGVPNYNSDFNVKVILSYNYSIFRMSYQRTPCTTQKDLAWQVLCHVIYLKRQPLD
jgi:hypothetical protein